VVGSLKFFNPKIAQRLYMAQQLQAYERISLKEHERLQRYHLFKLMQHAFKYSDFWRERLQKAGFDTDTPRIEAFHALPTLDRAHLQNDPSALRAHWPGLLDEQIDTAVTSGSTGQPVRVERAKQVHDQLFDALGMIDAQWHQLDARRPLAILGFDIVEEDRTTWGGVYQAMGLNGPCYLRPLLNQCLDDHLDWLLRKRPDYLSCSPVVAAQLAHRAMERQLKLPIKIILSKSERVTPRQRAICKQAFGAKINDRYSCEEVGWIAMQCHEHDHLHVLNASVLVEIVDEVGRACAPGEVGRVLLTSLHSFAMPLIRYEVGDLAAWGEPCSTGITLPVIARLWGRTRHLLTLPSGEFLPMPFLGDDIGKISAIRAFRVIHHINDSLELEIEAGRSLTEGELAELRRIFAGYQLNHFPLKISEVDSIHWGPADRKREEFISMK
jgi:phenylacetate-CoA ligase